VALVFQVLHNGAQRSRAQRVCFSDPSLIDCTTCAARARNDAYYVFLAGSYALATRSPGNEHTSDRKLAPPPPPPPPPQLRDSYPRSRARLSHCKRGSMRRRSRYPVRACVTHRPPPLRESTGPRLLSRKTFWTSGRDASFARPGVRNLLVELLRKKLALRVASV
jgi:hypothetical protein